VKEGRKTSEEGLFVLSKSEDVAGSRMGRYRDNN
jgi:hypothetical protein